MSLIDSRREKRNCRPIPRVAVNVSSFSETGRTCLSRAIIEGERRWCGNEGEEATGARVTLTLREMQASCLDVRTKLCPHMDDEERKRAKQALRDAHVAFEVQHDKYKEKAKQAELARAGNSAATQAAQTATQHDQQPSELPGTPQRTSSALDSGVVYDPAASGWGLLKSPSSNVEGMSLQEANEKADEKLLEARKQRAKDVVDRWLDHTVDFNAEFPPMQGKAPRPSKPDLIRDLMYLPIGNLYAKMLDDKTTEVRARIARAVPTRACTQRGIRALDTSSAHSSRSHDEQVKFGFLPRMAGCSKGQIGALMAESFCERMLSKANIVMTDGNTLLGDEELKMLVILKVNSEFMTWARSKTKYGEHLNRKGLVNGHPVVDKDQD